MSHLFIRNTIFILLAAYGYYALWAFAGKNGTFSLMREWSSQNRLPGTGETYKTTFTRWKWLDEYLRSLLTLFWPMVNGTHPGSSLMCFYFAGQGIAAWILTVLEGARRINKANWKVVSFTITYGLLFQGLGIGVVGPLFLAFTPLGDRWTSSVLVHRNSEVDAIIPATIGGVIIPTIAMSLHAPTVISLEQKVNLIRLWQFFPLIFKLGHHIWVSFISVWIDSYNDRLPGMDPVGQRSAFWRVYTFGLTCAAVTHLGTIAALLFPGIFVPAISADFSFANIFIPVLPFSNVKAGNVSTGAHWFLQWDMTLMFCSYLVWAYFADIRVKYPDSGVISISLVSRLMWWVVLFGPIGSALVAFWERDDRRFKDEEERIQTRSAMAANLASFPETEYKED